MVPNRQFAAANAADVHGLLVAQRIKDLRKLAIRADEYWVIRQRISPITSVGPVLQEKPVVHYPDDGILTLQNKSTSCKKCSF